MKLRNKITGAIREVPDNTVPIQSVSASMRPAPTSPGGELVGPAAGVSGTPEFIRGASRKVMTTMGEAPLRALGALGLPMAKAAVDKFEAHKQATPLGPAGDQGAMAADVGMMMYPTPFGKARAATTLGRVGLGLLKAGELGAQGAIQHQAQNYGQTGNVDVGKGLEEASIGTALAGAGSAAAPALKWMGVKTLEGLTRAPKRIERGMNPPSYAGYEQALKERIVPLVGAFGKAEKRGMALQGTRDAERGAILDAEGIRANGPTVLRNAVNSIASRGTGSRGLLPSQMDNGIEQMREYGRALQHPDHLMTLDRNAVNYGEMPGRQMVELRKMADQNAKFVAGKTPEGLDLASQEFRTAAEDHLGQRMAGKSGEKRYGEIKSKMAELAPVLEAFNDKAVSNYSWAPELIGAMTGAGLGVGTGSTALGLAPLALAAARRYPGVAPLLYEGGRAAGSGLARFAGKGALSLGRSIAFGGHE